MLKLLIVLTFRDFFSEFDQCFVFRYIKCVKKIWEVLCYEICWIMDELEVYYPCDLLRGNGDEVGSLQLFEFAIFSKSRQFVFCGLRFFLHWIAVDFFRIGQCIIVYIFIVSTKQHTNMAM